MSDSTPGRGGNYQKEVSTRARLCTSTDLANERYNYHHGENTLHETSRTQNFGPTGPNLTIPKPTDSSVPAFLGGTPIAEEVGKSRNAPIKLTMTGRNNADGGKSKKIKADKEEIHSCTPKCREGLEAPIRGTGNDFKNSDDRGDEFSSLSGDSNDGGASTCNSKRQAEKAGNRSEQPNDGDSLIWFQQNEFSDMSGSNDEWCATRGGTATTPPSGGNIFPPLKGLVRCNRPWKIKLIQLSNAATATHQFRRLSARTVEPKSRAALVGVVPATP